MTEEQQWQAPGSTTSNSASSTPPPPPPPPVMGAGQQAQPGYYGTAPVDPLAAGWAPPPKPGLIPLRPLSFGTILGASFKVLRRNPRPTFGAALLVQAASIVISLLFLGALTAFSVSRIGSAYGSDADAIAAGAIAITVVGGLLTVFVSLMGLALLQGIIVVEVARGTLGEKRSLRGLWRFLKGRVWALIGWSAMVGASVALVLTIVVGIATLFGLMGRAGVAFGLLFGILSFFGLVVLGAWLGTKLSLVASAIVLERVSIRAAIARSWSLCRGDFWKLFGIQALVGLILYMATYIIMIPFVVIFSIVIGMVGVNGDMTGATSVWVLVAPIAQTVLSVIIGSITSIVMTSTSSLLYLDMRMRKEGLDLELTRFVEARHMNADDDANPYLRAAAPQPGTQAGYTFA